MVRVLATRPLVLLGLLLGMVVLAGARWSSSVLAFALVAAPVSVVALVVAVAPSVVVASSTVAASIVVASSAVAASTRTFVAASSAGAAVVVLLLGVVGPTVAPPSVVVPVVAAVLALVVSALGVIVPAAMVGVSWLLGRLEGLGVKGVSDPLARRLLVRLEVLKELLDNREADEGTALGHTQDGLPGRAYGTVVCAEELLVPWPGVVSAEPPGDLDEPDELTRV